MQKANEINLYTFETFYLLFIALSTTFIYCYCATEITNKLDLIGGAAYQSKWYKYPNELQKFIMLIIAKSQQPMDFTALDMFYVNVETFGKVGNAPEEKKILF